MCPERELALCAFSHLHFAGFRSTVVDIAGDYTFEVNYTLNIIIYLLCFVTRIS